MFRRTLLSICTALTFLACNLLGPVAPPATVVSIPSGGARAAAVTDFRNQADARVTAASEWQAASVGRQIMAGGGVRTGDESRARLDISDGAIIRLGANTQFELLEFSSSATDPITRFQLASGKIWAAITAALGAGTFEVETPVGVATVRGSYMSVAYFALNGQMILACLEGLCRLAGVSGVFVDLQTGQQSQIPAFNQDPTPPQPIDTHELADWAAEFPEAQIYVATLTPGPDPTGTPTPPGGGGGFAGGQTACDHPYFPLRAGSTWNYSSADGDAVWTVTEVQGDATNASAHMTNDFTSGQATSTWNCDSTGIVSYEFGAISGNSVGQFATYEVVSHSGTWLPSPSLLVPGYSWSNDYVVQLEMGIGAQALPVTITRSEVYTLVSVEPVIVNGRSYDAIHVSGAATSDTVIQMPVGGANSLHSEDTREYVFALGVGIVRQSGTTHSDGNASSYSAELTSFSIP